MTAWKKISKCIDEIGNSQFCRCLAKITDDGMAKWGPESFTTFINPPPHLLYYHFQDLKAAGL